MYPSWFSYNLYAQMRPWSKRKDDVYQKLSSAMTSIILALALKTYQKFCFGSMETPAGS